MTLLPHAFASHVAGKLYMQEIMWKGFYLCMSVTLCFLVTMQFFDVFLFHHATLFLKTTHTESFMTVDVTEAFTTMLVLSGYVTMVCVLPLCLYMGLSFVLPSCFRYEAFLLCTLCALSLLLFAVSYILGLYLLSPLIWHFFVCPSGHHAWLYVPRLAPTLQTLLSILCGMHMLMQVPCLTMIGALVWHVPMQWLVKQRKRSHVILLLGCALLCPPDVWIQAGCWLCAVCGMESVVMCLALVQAYTLPSQTHG